jgi:hypothetical protein
VSTARQRENWRHLFASSTVGPWAHDLRQGAIISPSAGGHVVLRSAWDSTWTPYDLAFMSEARAGWPATLDALDQAERDRDEARNAIDHVRNGVASQVSALEARVRALETERDEALERCCNLETALVLTKTSRETSRRHQIEMEPLVAECIRWKKYRHNPNLLAAIARYEELCNRGS